ncbi:hypothetical protein LINPERPRIM_LOCUS984 [Linum perenne]
MATKSNPQRRLLLIRTNNYLLKKKKQLHLQVRVSVKVRFGFILRELRSMICGRLSATIVGSYWVVILVMVPPTLGAM